MKLKKSFFIALEGSKWFFISSIFFRFLLEFSYYKFVNPVYKYVGFSLDIDGLKYFESWFFYILVIAFFPKVLRKTSDYLMVYLLFSFILPLLVFYGFSNSSREHLYIVFLGVSLIYCFRNGPPFNLPVIENGKYIALNILWFGAFFVTVWMVLSGGLKYLNFDLTKVYEFRSDVGDLINEGPMAYLNVWTTKVFGPTLLAISLWRRKYYLAVAICALHVLWFGISAHKAVLFYPLLVFFVWAWFRSSMALSLIPIGMSIAVGLSLIMYLVFNDIFAGSLFIRRVFFVPSLLTFKYYEFFSQSQFVYWSNSIFSGFIDKSYYLSPAKVIGEYVGTGSNANNSFLSTGYMHAGVVGVIIYGVIVGLIFRLIDTISHKSMPPWFAVSVIIVPSNALMTSADLPAALLTHGFGVSVVILLLCRQVSKRSQSKVLR